MNVNIPRFGLLFWVFISGPGYGQDQSRWVQCSGEAALQNITYEEAQVVAKRQARLDAIEKVCGVTLQAETLVKDFVLAGDFIHSISYGHITEEENLSWKTEMLPPEDPSSPPVILLRLTMNAKVVPVNEKPDPYFNVDLNLNRNSFLSGDEVILTIKTTKDCYLTILNLAANDSVYILFPNQFQDDNFILADKMIEIPNKMYRDSGLHIRVANLPRHIKDTEIVKVIATKQRVNILSTLEISHGFGLLGTPKMAITQLAKLLSEIPISERGEATVMYTINSKSE